MNTKYIKENFKEDFLKNKERNYFIKYAIKDMLYDVAKNPAKYTSKQEIVSNTRHIALKEIAYVLTISIKEFLAYAKDKEDQIVSAYKAKSDFKFFINTNIIKLRYDYNLLKNLNTNLDKRLNELHNPNEKASDDPVIQFIYWSIKNLTRLCIDPKKDFLIYDVSIILKNYFDNIFSSIELYDNDSKKMTSREVRNFLSSTFVDKILESEFYQKTFQ